MCGLLHTWISIFYIAIPYLRPNKATNWNFLVPSGLFVTKAPCSSPFSPAQHNCWREESPNMWNTFLGQVIIFFLWVNEGNYKNWGEENDLWTCSNCLDFFLIFYYCKILNFGLLKVRFRRKKQKDVKDDGRPCERAWRGAKKVTLSCVVYHLFEVTWAFGKMWNA